VTRQAQEAEGIQGSGRGITVTVTTAVGSVRDPECLSAVRMPSYGVWGGLFLFYFVEYCLRVRHAVLGLFLNISVNLCEAPHSSSHSRLFIYRVQTKFKNSSLSTRRDEGHEHEGRRVSRFNLAYCVINLCV